MTTKEIVYKGATKCDDEDNDLAIIFSREIKNERVAWYVDYFTEDAEQFNVRYLVKSPVRLMMTNENIDQRDPADKDGSQWNSKDVAEWFGAEDGQHGKHTWVFIFQHEAGETFGIHCEAERVFAFGPRALSIGFANMWSEYVENGIRGPLHACTLGKDAQLVAIVDQPRWETLNQYGLQQDYMLHLAAVLDN